MNHIYRSIWSEALATWIAVSENSKGKGKNSTVRKKWLAASLLLCSANSWALPTGEQIVAGQVNVSTPNLNQMQINQSSQQAIVNWQGFSINPNEVVNIQQPNASATLLNRVVGIDASVIQGQLNANGQVYLVNPNGVLFSKTAQVDVGGLVATTHNIDNADFLNGNLHFTQNNANGIVSNQGYIKIPEGGVVALIGKQVSNSGTIETPKGSTILAAGKTVDLDFKGDGLVEVKVPEAALNAQVENKGAILADGGRVVLTAQAAGQLTNAVVNSEGLIQAKSLIERNGEIILDGGKNGVTQVNGSLDVNGQSSGKITVTGKDVNINAGANLTAQTLSNEKAGTIKVLADMDNGTVSVAGKLDASAPVAGDGGFVETSAAKVKIADSAFITTKATNGKTGTWLIDPLFDYTIAATGGDITGLALGNSLVNNDVVIESTAGIIGGSNGDINVNDVVKWSTNELTLSAQRNININANLNDLGSSKPLVLKYGQASVNGGVNDNYFINKGAKVTLPAGASFCTQKGTDPVNLKNYTVITELGAVDSVTATDLQGMNGDRTLNYALGSNIDASVTKDWNFNGTVNEGFLPIDSFIGSFDGLGHTVTNLSINRPNATGNVGLFADIGISAGKIYRNTSVSNVGLVGGNVIGQNNVGGFVGANYGNVINVFSTGIVTGNTNVGSLAGLNEGNINDSYAAGNVTGNFNLGGLIGLNDYGRLSNSHYDVDATLINGKHLLTLGGLYNTSATGGLQYTAWINSGKSPVITDYFTGNVQADGSTIYDVNTLQDMKNLLLFGDNFNFKFRLTSNIDLLSAPEFFIPYLGGEFDGNNHTISNLVINQSFNSQIGMIGHGVSVKNLGLINVDVHGLERVGGLGGDFGIYNSSVTHSYVTGTVNGSSLVGGLVGFFAYSNDASYQSVGDSYSTANVTGVHAVGGLVGDLTGANIFNSYATGKVTATNNVGGLVGVVDQATVNNSFWNTETTTQNNAVGITDLLAARSSVSAAGKTSFQMKQFITFSSWNVTTPNTIARTGGSGAVWRIYEGHTTPLLTRFMTPLTLTPESAGDITVKYDRTQHETGLANNTEPLLGTAAVGTNAGFYNGYYSTQEGYDITGGNLIITPLTLNIIGLSGSRSYDGTTAFDSSILTASDGLNFIDKNIIGLSGIGYVSSPNVGSYAAFDNPNIPSTLALSNTNYSLTGGTVSVEITKANLTIKANDASKTYGQTFTFNGTEFTLDPDGLRGGDKIATVELASEGATATASVESSPYAIKIKEDSAKGDSFLASNYDISYQDGKLSVLGVVDNPVDDNPETTPDDSILGGIITPIKPISSITPVAPAPGTEVEHETNPTIKPPLNDVSDDFGSKLTIETKTEIGTEIRTDIKSDLAGAKQPLNIIPGQNDNKQPIQPTLTVTNSAGRVQRLQMSANKQFLSLLLGDGSVRIWDFQRGVQRQINTQTSQSLTDIGDVNEKGELLSIASNTGIGTYDVLSSSADVTINEPNVNHFTSSSDGNLLWVNTGTNTLSLWDNKQNKELWQSSHLRGEVDHLALSDNKRYGAVLSYQQGAYMLSANLKLQRLTDAVDIVELSSGKVLKSLPNLGEEVVYMEFKDNDTLQLGLANGEMLNWSIANESMKTVGTFAESVTAIDTTKNSYAYVLKDGTVRVGDGQGQIQLSIKNQENPFQHAMLLEEGKKLLTVMANGDLSLWDVASGKKMLRLFSMQEGGWTVMDSFGRFDGSEEALQHFSWTADKENIPLDSFSENYYEPGLLASVLQNKDYLNDNPGAIKAGISLPPKVSLQLADQQTTGNNVSLQLDVYDRGGGINKIQVYHNGKLLRNDEVISAQQIVQEKDTEHQALSLNINPSAGKNTLKVTASNDMGIENSSAELNFDGKTKAFTSAIKLLTVGINQYSDSRLNLAYSVADANAIGDVLKSNAKITSSKNLYDKNATKPKILAELKEISQGAQQDVLVIYLAGHGMVVGKEWYFLPYETRLQATPEKIAATGITATELSDIFKSSKIQHILLMVDSCYSGAGMDAFSTLQNGQQYFARQLSRSLGITVITAAARDQGAAELKSLGHGLFTYLMTQELQKNSATESVTAHGIKAKIMKELPIFSKKMTGISQEPAAYTHGNDFILTDVLKK